MNSRAVFPRPSFTRSSGGHSKNDTQRQGVSGGSVGGTVDGGKVLVDGVTVVLIVVVEMEGVGDGGIPQQMSI